MGIVTKNIVINRIIKDKELFPIVPASVRRQWMDGTDQKFAYNCLPLNIANEYGWVVLSPADFSVSWYGGSSNPDVEIFSTDKDFLDHTVISHFGSGTFTIQLDFVIQTPKNYSLYIRGVSNQEHKIIQPLDAIVETDWLPFTFTYNFRFTDCGVVDFKKGDPLFMFFPIERSTVENFELKTINIEDNESFYKDYIEYSTSRSNFKSDGKRLQFQRFYKDGRGPNKKYSILNHTKRLIFGSKPDTIE